MLFLNHRRPNCHTPTNTSLLNFLKYFDAFVSGFKLVSKDRDRIAMIEAVALRSLQDMKPLGKVPLQADATCQTAFCLPAVSPQSHDTDK